MRLAESMRSTRGAWRITVLRWPRLLRAGARRRAPDRDARGALIATTRDDDALCEATRDELLAVIRRGTPDLRLGRERRDRWRVRTGDGAGRGHRRLLYTRRPSPSRLQLR